MEITKSELKQLLEVMEQKGISVAEAIELIKAHDGTNIEEQRIEAQLSEAQRFEMGEEVNLVVDYTKTVEEMMELAGLSCLNITSKNFPIPKELIGRKVNIKVKLNHYSRVISSDDVIVEINKEGFREGTIFELLALVIAFPDFRRKFPIIALGSVWHGAGGFCNIPVLLVLDSGRRLILRLLDSDWDGRWNFLATRK